MRRFRFLDQVFDFDGPAILQDLLGLLRLPGVYVVDRHERPALRHSFGVKLRLLFGDAVIAQQADESAESTPQGRTADGSGERAGREQRTHARNLSLIHI